MSLAGCLLCIDDTCNAHQSFSVPTIPDEFKNQQLPVIENLCLRETRSEKSRDYRDVIVHTKTNRRHLQIIPV